MKAATSLVNKALLMATLLAVYLCCAVHGRPESINKAAAFSRFQAMHSSNEWVAVCGTDPWWYPTTCMEPNQATYNFDANDMLPSASPSRGKCANIIRCPGRNEVYSVSVTFWAGRFNKTPVYYAQGVAEELFGVPGGAGIGVQRGPQKGSACWYRWANSDDGCACVCANILRAAPDAFQGCICGMP